MLSKLIILLLLVNILTALPASELKVQGSEEAWSVEKACSEVTVTTFMAALPASELKVQGSEEAWSVEKACSEVTVTTFMANQDDPTCSSYVTCSFTNGQARGLIYNCKNGTYFDDSLKMCYPIKPDVCA